MKKRHILPISILSLLVLAGAPALLAVPGPGDGERGPRGWESFAERHDVNGDGQVTREELFQTFDMFDRLDENGDGVVAEADFEAHRTAMAFGFAARRADDDRDRAVTAAEWDAWFAERDANGDGRLTVDDRPERAERGRHSRGPRPDGSRLTEALDADGDGAVTRADFAALAARYDANGDGVLSGEELPQLERRGPHGHHGRRGFHGRR